jgi:hypothetical protein
MCFRLRRSEYMHHLRMQTLQSCACAKRNVRADDSMQRVIAWGVVLHIYAIGKAEADTCMLLSCRCSVQMDVCMHCEVV